MWTTKPTHHLPETISAAKVQVLMLDPSPLLLFSYSFFFIGHNIRTRLRYDWLTQTITQIPPHKCVLIRRRTLLILCSVKPYLNRWVKGWDYPSVWLWMLLFMLREAGKWGATAESLIITDSKLSVVVHTYILNTHEDHKFKSSLSYIVSPKTAWATS